MAYSGRRGPNVSEYIANLNAIPTAQDLENSQDNFNLDDDLAMFTNTQFFDFDLGQSADLQNFGVEESPAQDDIKPFDLSSIAGDFAFPEFNNFTAPSTTFDHPAQPPAPLQTNQPLYPAPSSASSPTTPAQPAQKRKAESATSPADFEEASRLAAEEDKRRRNTAASARFRVKKKQREAALERSAKEMSDKVAALEGRINQLETENKWLKNLITEKNESSQDLAAMWKKYSTENGERKGSERKDGVGTKA